MTFFRKKPTRPSRESAKAGASTRARVVECIRRQVNTIEDIARTLGLTDNAVRLHVANLERAGLVRQNGVARRASAGQPPAIYELTEVAEEGLSRAYAPVLAACIEELRDRVSHTEFRAIVEGIGHRLAAAVGRTTGTLRQRVDGAARVLEGVGGSIVTTPVPEGILISGHSCPLATAVAREPATCGAMQVLIADLTGAKVVERCDHAERPRCRFLVVDS